jgi:hypothetical protein
MKSQTVNVKGRTYLRYVGKEVWIILKMDLSGSDYSLEMCSRRALVYKLVLHISSHNTKQEMTP